MLKRIWILFISRNKEFYRDRGSLLWNFLFPFLIILGFSFIFDEGKQNQYKIGIAGSIDQIASDDFSSLKSGKFIEFIEFKTVEEGLDRLKHNRIDLLIKPQTKQYWVSSSSPKGYIAEKILQSCPPESSVFSKQTITGITIPYIEWLFPGILGMNMMFSSLFGAGYVIVRYRKNGVLKRFSVTPLRPVEYLTSQVLSRMFVLFITAVIIYTGSMLIYPFTCRGSYFNLLLVFFLGSFCMVMLGLLVASRSSSEEFAGGIINLLTWPMMFFSEIWFSLEGAHPAVQKIAMIFPLTHIINAARRIMNDGADLQQIKYQVITLAVMSVVFLIAGSELFIWHNNK